MSKKILIDPGDLKLERNKWRNDRDRWKRRAFKLEDRNKGLVRRNYALENQNRALKNSLKFFQDPETARIKDLYIQNRHIIEAWDDFEKWIYEEIGDLEEANRNFRRIDNEIKSNYLRHIQHVMRDFKRRRLTDER